ncbi:MAG: biotin transporter BioY [Candidatus Protochlamydia sp.]|nr:biotin transporter BioY [Candidatus Protochlamydia sp.]
MFAVPLNSLPAAHLNNRFLLSAFQILGASLFLALCAQIRIPLYFSPVPLTGQTFGVLFIGVTMGSRKGLLSVLTYLLEGSLGLPVFAGGSLGIMSLLGTNGGYLIGFIFQVFLVGSFVERQTDFHAVKTITTLLFACALQLGLGVVWLSAFVGFETALMMGLYPFLCGELVKSMGVAAYIKKRYEKNSHL